MGAEVLGDEKVIDRLVRTDAPQAEKIMGKLRDMIDVLKRIGDAKAMAEYKRLKKAEKLYLDAIEAAGKKYVNGKIVSLDDDEEKESIAPKNLSYEDLDPSDYYNKAEIYSYDFLVSQKSMKKVDLPSLATIKGEDGKVNPKKVVDLGIENAKKLGEEIDGKVFVKNEYTGLKYQITNESIRHSLDGDQYRLRTNGRLGAVAGQIVKNAIPINGLKNKSPKASGTYAMAAYATDAEGREFISIITVEDYANTVVGIETYDVVHAVSGRQKFSRDVRLGTKPQGFNPSTNISATISIAQLLDFVKSTYQSILSDDVLQKLGEERNPKGYYADKALFSLQKQGNGEKIGAEDRRPTSYTKEEARAMVDSILALTAAEGSHGELKGAYSDVINRAHALLNSAEAGERQMVNITKRPDFFRSFS